MGTLNSNRANPPDFYLLDISIGQILTNAILFLTFFKFSATYVAVF